MKISRSLFAVLSGFLAVFLLAGCALPLGENYTMPRNDEGGGVYITDYNLETYVPIPYIGDPPVVQVTHQRDLEVNVHWKGGDGESLSFDAFQSNTSYTAEIKITPKNGYVFDSTQMFLYRADKVTDQQDDGDASARTVTVTYKSLLDPDDHPVPMVDSDGDGYSDDWELDNNYDPLDPNDHPDRTDDTDRDGIFDGDELDEGTDPTDPASHFEGGNGLLGSGNNSDISEENLLKVLGVSTVKQAIEELHQRLNNEGVGRSILTA
jgi:hypothetical protein